MTEGRPKGHESLALVVKELASPEMKKRIKEACGTETAAKLAEAYLLNRALSNLNYETAISPVVMSKLYPGLKVKLPVGAGRKKKAPKVDAVE
jgi:glycosyltransferase A (GT-A) superfamily protein (DUF2064 family)